MRIIKRNESCCRVLDEDKEKILIIDCCNNSMPEWIDKEEYEEILEEELEEKLEGYDKLEDLPPKRRKVALERYSIISGVLAVIGNASERKRMINSLSKQYGISKQSIRNYIKLYLVYQDIGVLAPKERHISKKELTEEQKVIRWSLNKYYYNSDKNSLTTAYTMMLKEKYTEPNGKLKEHYPSFTQFRYFYRKTRKQETVYISRNSLTDYQRNKRPLLGDGVQEFAPNAGLAMLDSTVCDIYLVENENVCGRPVLVAALDANTSLCLGYTLEWEGGRYSLNKLMMNILTDKVKLCESMGIHIEGDDWAVKDMLPAIMVTDQGSEYKSENFSQITELGVKLVNLPAYRPELKGPVEKFFDLIQSSFKQVLKGKGVVLEDFGERGSRDYRKDACLTLHDFERIIVSCIVYYNRDRILKHYPYTEKMLQENIRPHASDIFNYKTREMGANFIKTTPKELILTLLPRTNGTFTRYGLKVNKLRYYAEGYKEQYLTGGSCVVAYNPDDCGTVWIKDKSGQFIENRLIESRFLHKTLEQVEEIKRMESNIINSATDENIQARVDLISFIENVAADKIACGDIKDIREHRQRAINRNHINLAGTIITGGVANE